MTDSPTIQDLTQVISHQILLHGPLASRKFASDIAMLAVNAISNLYPEGWEIRSEPTPELMVFDDGISEGISRLDLLAKAVDDEDAGTEVEVEYRGRTLTIMYGIGDAWVTVNDLAWSPAIEEAKLALELLKGGPDSPFTIGVVLPSAHGGYSVRSRQRECQHPAEALNHEFLFEAFQCGSCGLGVPDEVIARILNARARTS